MYVGSSNQNINQNAVNQSSNLQFNPVSITGNGTTNINSVNNSSIQQARSNLSLATQDTGNVNSGSSLYASMFTQAYNIFNSDLSDENKGIALAQIGISIDGVQDLIGSNNVSNGNTVLNVAQTAINWGDLNDEDRINSVAQIIANSGSTLGVGATGLASIATGGYQVVQGFQQAGDIIDSVQDLPESQALKPGVLGLSVTGLNIGLGAAGIAAGVTALTATTGALSAGIGTFLSAGATLGPIGLAVGAAVGLVVAFTGSGKGTGQKLRDGWRDSLEQQGVAEVIDGAHHLTLADGSKYNVGLDGGHKIPNVGVNVDGNTERHTFDVDFSNEVTVASIPEGHVFAIATGLDPTSNEGHGLFERAMAQGLNAATSNATSVEQVRANYRAMLGDRQPEQIALRIEVLRATNKITEQEYGVYLHHLNKIFGSNIAVSNGEQAKQFIAAQLAQKPQEQWSKGEQELFIQLTDPIKIQESQEKLLERLEKERQARTENAPV